MDAIRLPYELHYLNLCVFIIAFNMSLGFTIKIKRRVWCNLGPSICPLTFLVSKSIFSKHYSVDFLHFFMPFTASNSEGILMQHNNSLPFFKANFAIWAKWLKMESWKSWNHLSGTQLRRPTLFHSQGWDKLCLARNVQSKWIPIQAY